MKKQRKHQRRILKDLLSLLLVFVMIVSSVPISAVELSDSESIANDNSGNDSKMTLTDDTSLSSSVDIFAPTNTNISASLICDDIQIWTLESIDEYEEFVASNKLPDDFIKYEEISSWGDFRALRVSPGGYRGYNYTLVDSLGYEFMLAIDHDEEDFNSYYTVDSICPDNMRKLSKEEIGSYIYHDKIQYGYYTDTPGELRYIVFKIDGVTYTISGNETLSDYPNDDSTIIGKLLNLDTALDALDSAFDKNVDRLQNNNYKILLYVGIPIVLVVGGTILFVVKKRNFKKAS